MFRRPPALADWLLERLGYTRQNAALAGDLLEEFRNGRSAGWYWRQTLAVVANGIANGGIGLRPYLLALSAAYAAQFAVTLTLWSKNSPPALHVSFWMRFGMWLLAQFVYGGCAALVNRLVVGTCHPNLKQMYCAVERRVPRSTIVALAGYQSFALGLANYCLCALIILRFSLLGLVSAEVTWFVLWIFAPAVLPALVAAATRAGEPVEDREPWLAIPQREPVITVALPDGRAILLERDRLAESIFAAADPELIRVAFGRGKSLELLRRAIWLGGYKSHSHIAGRAESLTLAELAVLIRQTARTAQVERALFDSNPRPSLWDRLNCAFRGDPL
jgi:hypothetical protein